MNRQRAYIRIMDPTAAPWKADWLDGVSFMSVEAVLLHEMLHIRFWDFAGGPKDLLPHEERAIEALVPLLLKCVSK